VRAAHYSLRGQATPPCPSTTRWIITTTTTSAATASISSCYCCGSGLPGWVGYSDLPQLWPCLALYVPALLLPLQAEVATRKSRSAALQPTIRKPARRSMFSGSTFLTEACPELVWVNDRCGIVKKRNKTTPTFRN
jgi:hypothetical protein